MRTLPAAIFLSFVVVAATLGIFAGVSRADHEICLVDPADGSCLNHSLTLPVVANDDFFVPVKQVSVQAGCVSRPVPVVPDPLTMMGFDVVAAPENFFYSHAFVQFNAEPFTHTGVLTGTLEGPGGPYGAEGETSGLEAALFFGQIEGPGEYSFSFPESNDGFALFPGGSTTEFGVPEDCIPLGKTSGNSRYVFDPTVPGGWLVVIVEGTATVTNGTCEPFETQLEVSFFRDGSATSLQPGPDDFNQGFFWPGPPVIRVGPDVGDDWFNIYVQNPDEPEAYLGAVSPDLTRIVGRTAWKDCLWDFELLVSGLVSERE